MNVDNPIDPPDINILKTRIDGRVLKLQVTSEEIDSGSFHDAVIAILGTFPNTKDTFQALTAVLSRIIPCIRFLEQRISIDFDGSVKVLALLVGGGAASLFRWIENEDRKKNKKTGRDERFGDLDVDGLWILEEQGMRMLLNLKHEVKVQRELAQLQMKKAVAAEQATPKKQRPTRSGKALPTDYKPSRAVPRRFSKDVEIPLLRQMRREPTRAELEDFCNQYDRDEDSVLKKLEALHPLARPHGNRTRRRPTRLTFRQEGNPVYKEV
ncbi:hypothetical protein HK097_010205, partial [Rhizophlyctis rosea]